MREYPLAQVELLLAGNQKETYTGTSNAIFTRSSSRPVY
jgi:hypothetical protein